MTIGRRAARMTDAPVRSRRKTARRPLRNIEIAERFEAIADMLALQEANPFRVRAYQNAARMLRRRGDEVADMIARGEDLTELEGVGGDLAGKIRDLAESGTTEIYAKLRRETPAVAFALLELPGLGPKRVRALVEELDIHTLDQLARAARDGRVRDIPGFGAKTEAALLKALQAHEQAGHRTPIASAAPEADALVAHLRALPGVVDAVAAGSFRRGRDTVGDLDLVASADAGRAVVDHFVAYPGVVRVLAAGATRGTVVLKGGLQVDLRVVRPESFGAALAYFTGSKAHVVAMRALARERGLKLNEYGLFRGEKRLAGADEASLYRRFDLDFIPPELREAQGEIEAARAHALPHLVELGDIKGDLHVGGDVAMTPLIAAARKGGLSYLAFASHLAHVDRAELSRRRSVRDAAQIAAADMRLLLAVEVDIAPDGGITSPANILDEADFVIAAADGDRDLTRAQQTERLLAAIANPSVAVIAHPTGRLIGRREPFDADWPRILRAAAAAGVAIELSGDPDRLDLTDVHCRMARDLGAQVILVSEARAPDDFDRLRFALLQARRGWLEPGHVLNTAPVETVGERLRPPRKSSQRRQDSR